MPRYCFAAISSAVLAAFITVSSAHAQSSDGDVEKRLLRLEEQIVDLSAQVGTLETITKGGGLSQAPAPVPAAPASEGVSATADDDRIILMETQLRALSSQIGELIERINQLEGNAGIMPRSSSSGIQQPGLDDGLSGQPAAQDSFDQGTEGNGAGGEQGGFDDYFGRKGNQAGLSQDTAPVQTAAQSSPEAQTLYEEAYNALIQRNYRAAAGNFRQFVEQFPTDPLAGQAYYWLGEAAFVNGQYSDAADSFLKSSTNYPQNQKAPESLLKLGIALKRLGETEAACSSFSELGRRFPQASDILKRAEKERRRAQCS